MIPNASVSWAANDRLAKLAARTRSGPKRKVRDVAEFEFTPHHAPFLVVLVLVMRRAGVCLSIPASRRRP